MTTEKAAPDMTIGELIAQLETLQASYGQEVRVEFFNENQGSLMELVEESLEDSHEEMPNGSIRIYLMQDN